MIPLESDWVVPVFTLVGTFLGATAAATVGWFDTRRRHHHEWRRDEVALAEQQRLAMTNRISEFLASTYHAVLSVRDVALAAPDEKRDVEKREIWPTVDRVNRCLTAVRVNDSAAVVAAVEALDRALVELSRKARAREYDYEEWRALRLDVIRDLPDGIIVVARREARGLQAGSPVRATY